MNWFDKWLSKKMHKAWNEAEPSQIHHNLVSNKTRDIVSRDRFDSNPDLNFRMFRAENGFVMEVRYHDNRTDRTTCRIHLIPDEADLGESISHIITLEALKVQ